MQACVCVCFKRITVLKNIYFLLLPNIHETFCCCITEHKLNIKQNNRFSNQYTYNCAYAYVFEYLLGY